MKKGEEEWWFFYSRRHEEWKLSVAKRDGSKYKRSFCRLDDDRVLPYTDKQKTRTMPNSKRFKDYHCLGRGRHVCTESVSELQTVVRTMKPVT